MRLAHLPLQAPCQARRCDCAYQIRRKRMTRSMFQVLTVDVGLAISTSAYSEAQCKPVVGIFEAQVVTQGCASPILCTAGRVWGGIQGSYAFTMNSAQPNAE